MTQRRKATPAREARPKTREAAVPTLDEVIAERDRLQAELDAAQSRIAELEAARLAAIDRIDWAIDSLHSLADERS